MVYRNLRHAHLQDVGPVQISEDHGFFNKKIQQDRLEDKLHGKFQNIFHDRFHERFQNTQTPPSNYF
jgi:hypothetical protein